MARVLWARDRQGRVRVVEVSDEAEQVLAAEQRAKTAELAAEIAEFTAPTDERIRRRMRERPGSSYADCAAELHAERDARRLGREATGEVTK